MDDKGSPIQLSIKEKEQVLDLLNNQKQQRTLTPTQWSLPMEWIYNIRISGEHDYQIIIKARRVWIYSESMKTVHKLLIEDDFYTKMDELLIS